MKVASVSRRGASSFVFALVLFFGCAPSLLAQTPKPDIVFILIDSLRADHVGCYGYARRTTPWIDGFAAESVRFETVLAGGSWTQPAVMTLFTSVTPDVHQRVVPEKPHSSSVTTLAETLRSAGYRTVGITANAMTARRYGFGRGFDVWDDAPATAWAGVPGATEGTSYADGAAMTRLGLRRWAAADSEKPLFLFLFYMDAHWEFRPPAPYDRLFSPDGIPPPVGSCGWSAAKATPDIRRRAADAYDGEIAFCDSAVSNLLTRILGTERGRRALVVLTGDHGEGFWERGFAGHGNNLSDDELRVPLVIRPPAEAAPAQPVVRGLVGSIDIAPTVLDLVQIPAPARWMGRSLVPAMRTGHAAGGVPIVSETRIAPHHGWLRSVRTDRWKLVAQHPFEHPLEVYDLRADPSETNNLVRTGEPFAVEAERLRPLLKPDGKEVAAP